LEHLINQEKPFYFTIAPTSPHVSQRKDKIFNPVPLARHENDFPEAQAPRAPNFNPDDDIQSQRASWIKTLPSMTDTQIDYADEQFRSRIRSLQGIDEILEDVMNLLDHEGCLENTYGKWTRLRIPTKMKAKL
jgi:N-acetylglucosamine-6-sulfatase